MSTGKILIKKYPNRRLYNTLVSNYVTLEDLFQMVKNEQDFIVVDSKSGDDITRTVLTQIIFEQEAKGYSLLPSEFLKKIIKYYDNKFANFLPSYLTTSMDAFTQNHDKFNDVVKETVHNFSPIKIFEELAKTNLQFMENAIKMFKSKSDENKNE